MADSTQQKLSRVRPPRVQITYDVETGDAIEKKQLPFVIGIMADLSGDKVNAIPLAERPFVEIDRDNFAAVMAQLNPTRSVTVAGTQGDETVTYDLNFSSLEGFRPDKLVDKLVTSDNGQDGVKMLWERRNRLRDLLTKLDGNDPFLQKLQEASSTTALLDDLRTKAEALKAPGAQTPVPTQPSPAAPEQPVPGAPVAPDPVPPPVEATSVAQAPPAPVADTPNPEAEPGPTDPPADGEPKP